MTETNLRDRIAELGKSIFDRGMTAGSSGNISVHLHSTYSVAVSCLPEVDPEDVLLANHGPVVAGESLGDAVYATEEMEQTARLYLLLHGRNPRCLTELQIAELRETFSLP